MSIECKTCAAGTLRKTKIYRMNGFMVFIGYCLLMLGLLGASFAGLILLSTNSTIASIEPALVVKVELPEESEDSQLAIRKWLEEEQIPIPLIDKIVSRSVISEQELQTLTEDQQASVMLARYGPDMLAFGFGVLAYVLRRFAVAILLLSVIGILAGWALVWKKRILRCDSCGSVALLPKDRDLLGPCEVS